MRRLGSGCVAQCRRDKQNTLICKRDNASMSSAARYDLESIYCTTWQSFGVDAGNHGSPINPGNPIRSHRSRSCRGGAQQCYPSKKRRSHHRHRQIQAPTVPAVASTGHKRWAGPAPPAVSLVHLLLNTPGDDEGGTFRTTPISAWAGQSLEKLNQC